VFSGTVEQVPVGVRYSEKKQRVCLTDVCETSIHTS